MTELLSTTPDSAASLSDWETKRAEHERRDAELRDVNKTAVFDALAADGITIVVVAFDPRSHRTVLFRALGSGLLYRIPNIKSRDYQLVDRSPG